jgi:hypothetical protein
MGSVILRYLVILLLLWGCLDDFLVSTANSDPADDTATSDNDQYLPSSAAPSKFRVLAAVPLQDLPSACCTFDPRSPFGANDALLRSPCYRLGVNPLYTLMSLQC